MIGLSHFDESFDRYAKTYQRLTAINLVKIITVVNKISSNKICP